MKIGIFADSHYSTKELSCDTRRNSLSLSKLTAAAKELSECELIVCLGDLIDTDTNHEQETQNLKDIAMFLNSFKIPVICVMGNHDAFLFTSEEFQEITAFIVAPYHFEADGKQLIFLDASYTKSGIHYTPGDVDWTDTDIPYHTDIEGWLNESDLPAYVFTHQNLDPSLPENYQIHLAEKIRSIFEASKKVKAVYQGHYHHGNTNQINGIDYITLNALCEGIEINSAAIKIIEI